MDFRFYLILIYFNSVKDLYSYSELVKLVGMTYSQLDSMLEELFTRKYLFYNEDNVISLHELGIKALKENGFYDINILKICNEDISNERFSKRKISIDDIYIPIDFTGKFKGYK